MSLRGSKRDGGFAIDPQWKCSWVGRGRPGGKTKRTRRIARNAIGGLFAAKRRTADALRLTGALREPIPGSVLEKLASCAPWLEFRCDFEDGAP